MVPICCYFNIALKVVKFKEEEVIVRAESSAAFLASSPLKTLKATLPGDPPTPKGKFHQWVGVVSYQVQSQTKGVKASTQKILLTFSLVPTWDCIALAYIRNLCPQWKVGGQMASAKPAPLIRRQKLSQDSLQSIQVPLAPSP